MESIWQQFGTAGVVVVMLVAALKWMAARWDRDRQKSDERWEKTTDRLTRIVEQNTLVQAESAAASRELRKAQEETTTAVRELRNALDGHSARRSTALSSVADRA